MSIPLPKLKPDQYLFASRTPRGKIFSESFANFRMNGKTELSKIRSTTAISSPPCSMLRRTAHRRHRDMRQRRSRRRAMPMTLAGSDVNDVADRDLALLRFRCRKTFARRHDENLIAIVDMPASR